MAASVGRLQDLARNIHRRDCPRVRRWLRTAPFERYKSGEAALTAAEKTLKPRAVDWEAILAFVKEILPIILEVIVK